MSRINNIKKVRWLETRSYQWDLCSKLKFDTAMTASIGQSESQKSILRGWYCWIWSSTMRAFDSTQRWNDFWVFGVFHCRLSGQHLLPCKQIMPWFVLSKAKRLLIWLPMLDINLTAFFDGDSSCHEMAQQWSLSMWTRSVSNRNDILFRLGLPLAIYHRVVNCYKHHKPIFDRYMMDEYTQKNSDESWWIIKFILR